MSISAKAPETETLRLARAYTSRGWSVVPVRPGDKLPAVEWAIFQREPAQDAQLVNWFESGGYGIGLVQGQVADTIILDFDGEAGMETRARLEAQYGPFPLTVEALTPGGGCHVMVLHPGRYVPTRRGLLPGMDVRGDGGFVVAHPSIHANGRRYEWDIDHHPEDVEVAPCPAWVAELVCSNAPGDANSEQVVQVIRPGSLGMPETVIADGRETYMRDTVLAVLSEMQAALGELPRLEQLFEAVWAQYSRKVDFTRAGRGANEVRAKCRYTLARVQAGIVKLRPREPKPDPEPAAEPVQSNKPVRPRILSIAEIEALPPPVWLVDGLIPERGLAVPYGPPKQGKTFVVLSMALHIAAGLEWMGKAVQQGGVVYIAGEGVGGLGLRIKAMRAHYGISDRVPFWVVPKAVNFSDPAAVADLVKLVRDTVLDEPIVLVVVDTLARAAPGVEENSSKEMGVVIASCDAVRDALECTVMPIHHAGKDASKGLRGSSAIHGAVDASFQISGTGKQVTLTPVDQKEADPGPPLVFEMVEIAVGIGRSSLVPVLADSRNTPEHVPGTSVLKGQEVLAMRALDDALAEHGQIITGSSNVPGNVPVCKDETWREAFRKLKADTDWQSARVTFRRVANKLIEHRIVGCSVPYVWRVRND